MTKTICTWVGWVIAATVWFTGGPLSAQYFPETVTEKSFEQSELFFQSSFLNTFGLQRFRDVSVGLIDEPFLNLQVNPGLLPDLDGRRTYFYLDFRGVRKERVEDAFLIHPVHEVYTRIAPDFRPSRRVEAEPEPFLALGGLVYPPGTSRLLIGGTLQLVHRQEPFFSTPYWIYYGRLGFDAFGNRVAEGDIPIIDRQSGTDEMLVEAQLYAGFLGYRISDYLTAGVSVNGVNFDRNGAYLFRNRSPFGGLEDWRYQNFNQRERSQDYSHLDLSGGVQFHLVNGWAAGLKIGQLDGEAGQRFTTVDSSFYDYQRDNVVNWAHNFQRFITRQNWDHDGQTRYAGFNFQGPVSKSVQVKTLYRFAQTDIDLRNSSSISDTGYYESQYRWNDGDEGHNRYNSAFFDRRSGRGTRDIRNHRALLSFEWQLTPKNLVTMGILYTRNRQQVFTAEPVVSARFSEGYYFHSNYNPDATFYTTRLNEQKTVEWEFDAKTWTVQIPVLSYFRINRNWQVMIGVNRVQQGWDIREQTTALFQERTTTEDGETRREENFGERYLQPRQQRTDEFTDVITSVEATLSPQFRVSLLVDPDFENSFRIAQWWLNFKTTF